MGEDIGVSKRSACRIVKAFVSHNSVSSGEVPALILNVHAALVGLGRPRTGEAERLANTKPTRAEIARSVTDMHLISFEDGKPYAMLKRHLTFRGLSPEAYRRKWGLPFDYPMVAKHFTLKRSDLARRTLFGHKKDASGRPVG